MRSSRGVGAVAPTKMPKPKQVVRKDTPQDVTVFKKGGEVWDKPRPDSLGKPKKLSPAKKSAAKAAAKAAGRPYPNMIDNIRAARKK